MSDWIVATICLLAIAIAFGVAIGINLHALTEL